MGILNLFPAPLEGLILFLFLFWAVWMADRQVSLQEEDLLVYQLRWETSSPLANCAASALFPHERAMSEVAAFNSCSKFDGGRKSQPAVKHKLRKISLSQQIRDGPA